MPTRRSVVAGIGAAVFFIGGPTLARGAAAQPVKRNPLRILPVLDTSETDKLDLEAIAGETEFLPGANTPTLGFGQPYLGPVIRLRRGRAIDTVIRNRLRQPITLHWHGLMVPAAVDGGPHLLINSNDSWKPRLRVDQPAATLWYHSHVHERTGEQVHSGLAGVLLVDDGVDAGLGLPTRYGVDDLVLVLQDKRFDPDGVSRYSPAMPDLMAGFRGDAIVVNGTVRAVARVPQGIVRLRLVNAANARIFDLSFADRRLLHLIGTDLGLLPSPIEVDHLRLAPGERAEVLVDFANGNEAELVTGPDGNAAMGMMAMMGRGGGINERPLSVLSFIVDRSGVSATSRIPRSLVADDPPRREATRSRQFSLDDMMMGPAMRRGASLHAINGRPFAMDRLDFSAELGTTERWSVRSTMMAHPFHVHGVRMRVLAQEGGLRIENAGWKDTVLVDRAAELLVEFDRPADPAKPYMMHCHILEHEDTGMMAQFAVQA